MRIKKQPNTLTDSERATCSWSSLDTGAPNLEVVNPQDQDDHEYINGHTIEQAHSNNKSKIKDTTTVVQHNLPNNSNTKTYRGKGKCKKKKDNVQFYTDKLATEFYQTLETTNNFTEIHTAQSNDLAFELTSFTVDFQPRQRGSNYTHLTEILRCKNYDDVAGFWFYDNDKPHRDMLYCELRDPSLNRAHAQSLFVYVDIKSSIPRKMLQVLNRKVFYCVIKDDVATVDNDLTIGVFLTNDAFPAISSPSQLVIAKPIYSAIKVAMQELDPSLSIDVKDKGKFTMNHDAEQFYKELKHHCESIQSPNTTDKSKLDDKLTENVPKQNANPVGNTHNSIHHDKDKLNDKTDDTQTVSIEWNAQIIHQDSDKEIHGTASDKEHKCPHSLGVNISTQSLDTYISTTLSESHNLTNSTDTISSIGDHTNQHISTDQQTNSNLHSDNNPLQVLKNDLDTEDACPVTEQNSHDEKQTTDTTAPPSSAISLTSNENSDTVIQHPSLIPTLRQYQCDAVRWMLGREASVQSNPEQADLHPSYREVRMADGIVCYYNIYSGFFVKSRPTARVTFPGGILADEMGLGKTVEFLACMLHHPRPIFVKSRPTARVTFPGGILADEMGLGKTVEFLACMLHHPRPNMPDVIPKSMIDDLEWETQKKLKPCNPTDIKESCQSSHASDDTIEYFPLESSGDDDDTHGNCVDVINDRDIHDLDTLGKNDVSVVNDQDDVIMDGSSGENTSGGKNDLCGSSEICDVNGLCNQDNNCNLNDIGNKSIKILSDIGNLSDTGNINDIDESSKVRHQQNGVDKLNGKLKDVQCEMGENDPYHETESKLNCPNKRNITHVSKTTDQCNNDESSNISDQNNVHSIDNNPVNTNGEKTISGCIDVGESNTRKRRYNGELVKRKKIRCHCGVNTATFCLGKNEKEKITVECTKCGVYQHAVCVNYDLTNAYRDDYLCLSCCLNRDPLPSAATVIISPAAISHQWCEEIEKHIREQSLRVYVYTGIKKGFIHPLVLSRYDIVIMTYDTLRQELDFVDIWKRNSMRLRHAKRFVVLPSPIVAVEWWRVCLDEAQMVEASHTKTAEMAHRLFAVNMWCVTGTPIHRTLNDLQGLMAVLGIDPYLVHYWFKRLLYDPYCHGNKAPMYEAMSKIMWRSSKCDVLDQIDIPAQKEVTHWLTFSPVEEHFYRRTFHDCHKESTQALAKWTDSSVKLNTLDNHTVKKLLHPLTRLRQACCHPQAVRGAFLSINKSTMTMGEVLQSLIKKVRLECEELHRQVVAANNGLAALAIIGNNYVKAVELYREVLREVDELRVSLRTDDLQQLHAVYNLHEILAQKPEGVSPTLRDDDLPRLAKEFERKYVEVAENRVATVRDALVECQEDLAEVDTEFEERRWWFDHVITYICDDVSADTMIEVMDKIQTDIRSRTTGGASNRWFFMDENGLRYLVWDHLELLDTTHTKLSEAIAALNQTPTPETVRQTAECCLRPSGQDHSVTLCVFCKADGLFNEYEEQLFNVTDDGACHTCHTNCSNKCAATLTEGRCVERCHLYCRSINAGVTIIRKHHVLSKKKSHRTWADSDLQTTLKIILSSTKLYAKTRELYEYGCTHMKVFEARKKEFKALRAVWLASYEHVAALDELSMATTRLRLRLPDEPMAEPRLHHVIEKGEVTYHYIVLISDKRLGKDELSKKLGQLSYLQNLEQTETNKEGSKNPEPCPICKKDLGYQWSVLKCGHCFCHNCLEFLMAKCSKWQAPVRCAICRDCTHASNVSYVSIRGNSETGDADGIMVKVRCAICRDCTHASNVSYVSIRGNSETGDGDGIMVKGSHSTKVDGIVRCLLNITSTEPSAKVLIFSSWLDILDVIADALEENHILFAMLDKRQDFQNNLTAFKHNADITALLLPVQSGANGLNLIEATHVLLAEPTLNISQQLQAIGRVHRIGQTKPTTVHHFLVRGTIEQRIQSLLHTPDHTPDPSTHPSSDPSSDRDMTIGKLTSLLSQNDDDVAEIDDEENDSD